MTYQQAVDSYISNCKSAGKSNDTITSYKRTLDSLGSYLSSQNITDIEAVSAPVLAAWKAIRAPHLSAASMNLYLTHVRTFFNFTVDMDMLTKSPYKKILSMEKSALRREKSDTYDHLLTEQDFRSILSNHHPKDAHKATYSRNKAILLLLFTTGIRAMSISALTLNDVEWKKKYIHIRVAKGGKTGYVPLTDITRWALQQYLEDYPSLQPSDPLFGFTDEHGQRQPYSTRQMSNTVEAAVRSLTDKEGYYAHSLRHSFSSLLANHGIPTDDISFLMFHSKGTGASVTTAYITRDMKALFTKVDAIFTQIASA